MAMTLGLRECRRGEGGADQQSLPSSRTQNLVYNALFTRQTIQKVFNCS